MSQNTSSKYEHLKWKWKNYIRGRVPFLSSDWNFSILQINTWLTPFQSRPWQMPQPCSKSHGGSGFHSASAIASRVLIALIRGEFDRFPPARQNRYYFTKYKIYYIILIKYKYIYIFMFIYFYYIIFHKILGFEKIWLKGNEISPILSEKQAI